MDIDEMRAVWQAQTEQLAGALHVARADRTSTELGRVHALLWFEVAMAALGVLLIGSFAGDHFTSAGLFIPAFILGVVAIALLGETIAQLVLIRSIDPAAAVVSIQKQLETLGIHRIRLTFAIVVLAPLLWVPLGIVFAGALGLDAYAIGAPVLLANIAFGCVVLIVGTVAARRYSTRLSESSVARVLADNLAGTSIRKARASLESISAFEREAA